MRRLLSPVYRFLDRHVGYALIQKLGRPTVRQFRTLLRERVGAAIAREHNVLDSACGVGGYREFIPGQYIGVDINIDYVRAASAQLAGSFLVMDCRALAFTDAAFDHVVMIAASHHLDDTGLRRAIAEALRVVRGGGSVHVLDAVLPLNRLHIWKEVWFRLDRGEHPRSVESLVSLLGDCGRVVDQTVLQGPLHDVLYAKLTPGRRHLAGATSQVNVRACAKRPRRLRQLRSP
jgi:SAM-dependent methyltransferase